MTRKTCKLLGHEFPAPISADELSPVPSSKDYYLLEHLKGVSPAYTPRWSAFHFVDFQRPITLHHINTGMAHWTREGAIAHAAALDAITAHCIKHAA